MWLRVEIGRGREGWCGGEEGLRKRSTRGLRCGRRECGETRGTWERILADVIRVWDSVPPAGVAIVAGVGADLLVNIGLTLLGYVSISSPYLGRWSCSFLLSVWKFVLSSV